MIEAEGQFVTPLVVVEIGSLIAAYPNGTKSADIPLSLISSGTSTQICRIN